MTRPIVALLAAWLVLSLFLASLIGFHFSTATPDNFYGMQTEAFMAGQLSLKLAPRPELAKLSNPYEADQNLPYRIRDLSYYKGRYYSYFGVGPILYLLLPWRALSGTFLRDQAATVILEMATNLAALALLLRLRERFPRLGTAGLVGAFLLVSLGSWQTLHVPPANAGTIAQASAYLWLTLGLLCLDAALQTGKNRWLAGLSLSIGMMLASRPSFLPSVLLFLPLASSARARSTAAWAAAVVPLGAILAGLLAYNAARFDSPLEFGNRLQMVDHDNRRQALLGARYLATRWLPFLVEAPRRLREYPFFETGDYDPIGLFWACPAVLLLIPALLGLRRAPAGAAALLGAAGLTACGLFVFLASYSFYLLHYSVDFFFAFAWVAGLGWFVAVETAESTAQRRLFQVCGWALILVGAIWSSAFTVELSDRAPWIAVAANSAAYRIERLAGLSYGPLRIRFTLTGAQPGKSYPLVSLARHNLETTYLKLLPRHRAQLGILQTALGPLSEPFDFDPVAAHVVELHIGSLLPPVPHPLYDGWTEAEVQQAVRLLEISLDGKTIVFQHGESLGSEAGRILLGRDTIHTGYIEPDFPGSISMERMPFLKGEWAGDAFPKNGGSGVAFSFQLNPAMAITQNQPLASIGLGRGGMTIYVRTPDPRHAVFGTDAQGYGGSESTALPFDPLVTHQLEVYPPGENQLGPTVFLDGGLVLVGLEPAFTPDPNAYFYGANAAHSSVVQPSFSGSIADIRRLREQANLHASPGVSIALTGPVTFDAQLDASAGAAGQPLLSSGHTGKADILYLRATGASSLIVGHDHWGIGATQSAPIAVDTASLMHWRIELAETDSAAHRAGCYVWLNGTLVFYSPYPPYPIAKDSVQIGGSPEGCSSCGTRFSGRLLNLVLH